MIVEKREIFFSFLKSHCLWDGSAQYSTASSWCQPALPICPVINSLPGQSVTAACVLLHSGTSSNAVKQVQSKQA